jgi:pimeloyl-ACP methyl ester carboxylesterase
MNAATKLDVSSVLSDAPPPQLVRTPRGAVECVITGEGPAVLALHGAMGGWDQSLLLARTVGAPGFRTIAISRPGYLGTSLAAGRSPAEQADLYRDVLDALGVGRVAVMAVSGGGPSALELARRHGDRCWGAVIVSSVCRRNPARIPLTFHLLKIMARIGPLTARMRRTIEADPEAAARRSILDPELRARTVRDPEAGPLLHALQLSTATRMAERLAGTDNDVRVTTRGELRIDLEAIAVPALIVHGTADRVAPFEQGQEMGRRIPGAALCALDGGDHVAIFTHRAEAQAAVARFLRAHAPRDAGGS